MKPSIISTDHAPRAVGPYSQALACGDWVFLSGQIGLTPEGTMAGEDVEAQFEQVLKNLDAVLAAAGCGREAIVKVTIYLVDMDDFPRINRLYGAWLGEHRPARATVAVAALPLGAKVEMDLIACTPQAGRP